MDLLTTLHIGLRRKSAVLVSAVTMAIALSPAAGAQTKRPMAVDDLIRAIRISDPQLSPDGRRVLYVRTAGIRPA